MLLCPPRLYSAHVHPLGDIINSSNGWWSREFASERVWMRPWRLEWRQPSRVDVVAAADTFVHRWRCSDVVCQFSTLLCQSCRGDRLQLLAPTWNTFLLFSSSPEGTSEMERGSTRCKLFFFLYLWGWSKIKISFISVGNHLYRRSYSCSLFRLVSWQIILF